MAHSHAWFERRYQQDRAGSVYQRLLNLDDNAEHWHDLAVRIIARIVDQVGVEVYHAWCDSNLPDTLFSWRYLYDKVAAYWIQLQENGESNDPSRQSRPDPDGPQSQHPSDDRPALAGVSGRSVDRPG